jgi:hypothetical protein
MQCYNILLQDIETTMYDRVTSLVDGDSKRSSDRKRKDFSMAKTKSTPSVPALQDQQGCSLIQVISLMEEEEASNDRSYPLQRRQPPQQRKPSTSPLLYAPSQHTQRQQQIPCKKSAHDLPPSTAFHALPRRGYGSPPTEAMGDIFVDIPLLECMIIFTRCN